MGGKEKGGMSPRTLKLRVEALTESITYQGFNYTRRGTFWRHKLLVATLLCLRILIRKGLLKQDEVDALIMKEVALDPPAQPEKRLPHLRKVSNGESGTLMPTLSPASCLVPTRTFLCSTDSYSSEQCVLTDFQEL